MVWGWFEKKEEKNPSKDIEEQEATFVGEDFLQEFSNKSQEDQQKAIEELSNDKALKISGDQYLELLFSTLIEKGRIESAKLLLQHYKGVTKTKEADPLFIRGVLEKISKKFNDESFDQEIAQDLYFTAAESMANLVQYDYVYNNELSPLETIKKSLEVSVTGRRYQVVLGILAKKCGVDFSNNSTLHQHIGNQNSFANNKFDYGDDGIFYSRELHAFKKEALRVLNENDGELWKKLDAFLRQASSKDDLEDIKKRVGDNQSLVDGAIKFLPKSINPDNIKNAIEKLYIEDNSDAIDESLKAIGVFSYLITSAELGDILSGKLDLRKRVKRKILSHFQQEFFEEMNHLDEIEHIEMQGDEILYRGVGPDVITADKIDNQFENLHFEASHLHRVPQGIGSYLIVSEEAPRPADLSNSLTYGTTTSTSFGDAANNIGSDDNNKNYGWIYDIRPKVGKKGVSLHHGAQGKHQIDFSSIDPQEISAIYKVSREKDQDYKVDNVECEQVWNVKVEEVIMNPYYRSRNTKDNIKQDKNTRDLIKKGDIIRYGVKAKESQSAVDDNYIVQGNAEFNKKQAEQANIYSERCMDQNHDYFSKSIDLEEESLANNYEEDIVGDVMPVSELDNIIDSQLPDQSQKKQVQFDETLNQEYEPIADDQYLDEEDKPILQEPEQNNNSDQFKVPNFNKVVFCKLESEAKVKKYAHHNLTLFRPKLMAGNVNLTANSQDKFDFSTSNQNIIKNPDFATYYIQEALEKLTKELQINAQDLLLLGVLAIKNAGVSSQKDSFKADLASSLKILEANKEPARDIDDLFKKASKLSRKFQIMMEKEEYQLFSGSDDVKSKVGMRFIRLCPDQFINYFKIHRENEKDLDGDINTDDYLQEAGDIISAAGVTLDDIFCKNTPNNHITSGSASQSKTQSKSQIVELI